MKKTKEQEIAEESADPKMTESPLLSLLHATPPRPCRKIRARVSILQPGESLSVRECFSDELISISDSNDGFLTVEIWAQEREDWDIVLQAKLTDVASSRGAGWWADA